MPRLGYSGTLTEQQIKDLAAYLRDRGTIPPLRLNLPRLVGIEHNPGIA